MSLGIGTPVAMNESMRPNAISLFLMSALAACSAEGVGEQAEPDAGIDIVEDVRLEVDPPDASTYWSSVPMTGHGPAGGTLRRRNRFCQDYGDS